MSEEAAAAVAEASPSTAPVEAPVEAVPEPAAPAPVVDLAGLENATELPAPPTAAPAADAVVKIGEAEIPRAELIEALNGPGGDDLLRAIKRKVKANGEEMEISLFDALGEVPKAAGWQKHMYEANKIKDRLREQVGTLGKAPIDAFMEIFGERDRVKVARYFAEHAMAELKREQMSPKDRARLEEQEALRRDAEEGRKAREERLTAAQNAEVTRAQEAFVPMIGAALKDHGLPNTPYQISRVASVVADWGRRGVIKGDATQQHMQQAAKIVRDEYTTERGSMYSGLSGDDLLSAIGDDKFALEVAKAVAARYQANSPRDEAPASGEAEARVPTRAKPLSMREWKKQADKRMRKHRK